jgi:hypothetical protein
MDFLVLSFGGDSWGISRKDIGEARRIVAKGSDKELEKILGVSLFESCFSEFRIESNGLGIAGGRYSRRLTSLYFGGCCATEISLDEGREA